MIVKKIPFYGLLAFLLFISFVVIPWHIYKIDKSNDLMDIWALKTHKTSPDGPTVSKAAILPEIPFSADATKEATEQEVEHAIKFESDTEAIEQRGKFLKNVFDMIEAHKPPITKKLDEYPDGKAPSTRDFNKFSPEKKYLKVDQYTVDTIKQSHEVYIEAINDLQYPSGLFKGNGVVIVGGGKFMPIAMTTVRMFRRVDLETPIEIFVPELEPVCQNVLPALNVRCVKLNTLGGKVQGYQYKSMALIQSSFENVLLLDADNFPIRDPSKLFRSKPFTETGFVLWPDYWLRTTSPHFLNITQLSSYAQLPTISTESGQILVSKRKHFKSLLLATYYNFHGYTTYYPLLSQGAMGEGDKETFAAGAAVMNEPLYQVKSSVKPAGYHLEDGYHGVAMLQMDPIKDYETFLIKGDLSATPDVNMGKLGVPPTFLHNHMHKMDPMDLVLLQMARRFPNSSTIEQMPGYEKYRLRIFGKLDDWQNDFGQQEYTTTFGGSGNNDKELEVWQEAQWMVCEMAVKRGVRFKVWDQYKWEDYKDACDRIELQVKWISQNPNPSAYRFPDDIGKALELEGKKTVEEVIKQEESVDAPKKESKRNWTKIWLFLNRK